VPTANAPDHRILNPPAVRSAFSAANPPEDIMKRFEARQAILEAAGQKLSPQEMRRLRLAMALRPIKTQAAIDTVVLNCQAAQLVSDDGEVEAAADWSAIIALILELLPIILKLFGLG
jgi:hypothetical protein